MHIRWLQSAKRNLDHEISYIAEENPEIAVIIYAHIRKRVNELEQFPNLGRHGRIANTRELVIQAYPFIIPYRVQNDEIQILRVFNTKRDLPLFW